MKPFFGGGRGRGGRGGVRDACCCDRGHERFLCLESHPMAAGAAETFSELLTCYSRSS